MKTFGNDARHRTAMIDRLVHHHAEVISLKGDSSAQRPATWEGARRQHRMNMNRTRQGGSISASAKGSNFSRR